jgi:hypothetical protein
MTVQRAMAAQKATVGLAKGAIGPGTTRGTENATSPPTLAETVTPSWAAQKHRP